MMMSGDRAETAGTLLRVHDIRVGSLVLSDVGVLAAAPSRNFPGNLDLFDWYARKNAVPVIGWIVVSVLGVYNTIDSLWLLWDRPFQQCLYDKYAKTTVVKVPA